jgi:uncharacterized repeat protein (TIGR03843 family)
MTDQFDVLLDGSMEIEGRMPYSSNATFLVTLREHPLDDPEDDPGADSMRADDQYADEDSDDADRDDDDSESGGEHSRSLDDVLNGDGGLKAIYKPHRGERPLWDFPDGLYRREVAAYELAALLGWNIIPRTVRREGLFGLGSVQTFVDADFSEHYFTMMENRPSVHDQFRIMATFDLIANNADRKAGHVLLRVSDDSIWGIDQGLCFHEEPKLRTVLWDFAGEKIPKQLRPDVERVAALKPGSLGPLDDLLNDDEISMMLARAQRVAERPFFPHPKSDYAYPWPMV